MTIGNSRTITIVGAGLGGALSAIYLARLGFRVNVFERRSDPRKAGYSGGRSINLALSARGIWGLAGVGIDKAVLERALPMRGRMMHSSAPGSATAFQAYSKSPSDAINSISRSELNVAILEACEREDSIELFFNQRCLDVDLETPSVTFADESIDPKNPVVGTITSELIIGADGAFSAVRARMQRSDRFEYQQTYLAHGYKELHIPATAGPSGQPEFAMDPTALHIWPRKSAMMIALPNLDKSFTCTLFWPFTGDHGFESLRTADQVKTFFRAHYPDTLDLMPTLVADYLANPVSSLVTVRCWPWWLPTRSAAGQPTGKGVALLGDASHAIVPFFGQGMNSAFEDCRVLAECIERSAGDLDKAMSEYQHLRKPNADAIADMALENFVEMRDKVGSRAFRFKKKLEHFLHDLFPATLVPRYHLVSFTTVPYAVAKRQGDRINLVLRAAGVIVVLLLMLGLVLLKIPAWTLLLIIVLIAWLGWELTRARSEEDSPSRK